MKNKNAQHPGYKWVIVALCFIMVMITLGFASSTRSLFPDEIAKNLGTERSLVSIGDSFRFIATSIVNVFFGYLISKFGAKKLIMAGFFSLISSMLLYATATNLFVIYIAGALLGVGFSWTSTSMVGYVIGIWCKENKGAIMGAVLAANGLGGAIAIQIVGAFINPNVIGSYRSAYYLIAAVIGGAALLLFIFFRDKKSDESPINKTKSINKKSQQWVGISFSDATKKFTFWGILICIFFSGLIIQGISGIVAMHMKDVGVDYGAVTALLSFGSIILAGSKFLTGFLYDRLGLRLTASFCTAAAIIAPFLLAFTSGGGTGFVLAICYVIIKQFALPLETIMLPIYAADLFGSKSYAKILGIFVSVNTAGYAVGAPLMNSCYDIFGSYVPALYLVGGIMAMVFILLQIVITIAHRDKQQIIEAEPLGERI